MLGNTFNFSSSSGVKRFGLASSEVIAAPMQNVAIDRAVLANICSDTTSLVTLSQQGNLDNSDVVAELEQVVPFLETPDKRSVTTFYGISLLSLIDGDSLFRQLLSKKLNIPGSIVNDMSFINLRTDIKAVMDRLSHIVDFSRIGGFGFRLAAPGQQAARWHKDSNLDKGIFRGVRNLTVAGMDVALNDDFSTSVSDGGKTLFHVSQYGSTAIGLSVMHKHPDEGCPLHRISASNTSENRWSYIVEGYRMAS